MFMFHAWFEMKFWVNSVQVSQIEATSNSAICQDSPHKISHRHGATRGNATDLYMYDLPVAATRLSEVTTWLTSRQKGLYLLISRLLYIFYQNHLAVSFLVPHIQCKHFLILWDMIFRHYHNSSLSVMTTCTCKCTFIKYFWSESHFLNVVM